MDCVSQGEMTMPARSKRSKGPEQLGEINVPSGKLIVIDTGLLKFWCHDRPPMMEEGTAPNEVVAMANSSADYRIEGKDAERAGKLFDRQWDPGYLFDFPACGFEKVEQSFAECIRQAGFDARLTILPQKVTHRDRVDLALTYGHGAGEVFFHGITAPVLDGLPRERTLPVYGERMPPGSYDDRWRRVWLECQPKAKVVRAELVGHAAVDEARQMFADVDALGAWQHVTSLDGLADYVFWGGPDAAQVAERLGAIRQPDDQWGWVDLPIREAVQLGLAVEDLREKESLKFAGDFRPHSHHYMVMKQVRATATESGTIEVGGAKVCTFMTTWGDGFYPVFCEMDARGGLLRISIDLGNEQIVARQGKLESR
jgi:hypothetical protein